ncbi:hypothetical protein BDC45DRAFT_493379 [Circinella umbellata]|nr:hypothetical protein BDC45DRAFT_493379 [Circinella umbellata]
MKVYSKRSTPSRQQPTKPSQKRALPPRHSFLTDAVQNALEKQTNKLEPHIDGNTILCITNDADEINVDLNDQQVEYNKTELLLDHPPQLSLQPSVKPVFTVFDKPPRRPRRRSSQNVPIHQIEPIPEEYYIKRHRKHEKEEKKLKNREKERLQHEMYQQQQFVERIRHTDKSILMAIATSLKQQEEMNTNQKLVLPQVLPDVDVLYRQVLYDAEEHLRRYEMLGLTRKSRKEEYKSTPSIVPNLSSIPASPPASPPHTNHTLSTTTTTTTNKIPDVSLPSTTSPPSSPPPATHQNTIVSSTITASPSLMTTQKKPFKSFYKNKNNLKKNESPSLGKRRSARNILAFGHRIPPMRECDFHLPMEEYGEQMEKRANNKWNKKQKNNKKKRKKQ